MLTDEDFKNWYESAGGYINAVYIKDYDSLDHKADREYSPLDEGLHSVTKLSINYKYVETKIDMSANTLLEAIENKNYIRDECWINTIVDFYGDNLMSDKKRNRVTRETILQDIGMSEEDIQKNVFQLIILFLSFLNIIYNLKYLMFMVNVFLNIILLLEIIIIKLLIVWLKVIMFIH